MIAAIVPAAGQSRRMGAQKLLLPVAGKPMVACVVDALLAAAVDEVLVVVGRDSAAIAEALAGRAVHFVQNPDPEGDMLSSVRCGVRGLPSGCRAVLVALGDQPLISAQTVTRLVEVYRTTPGGIVVPCCDGRRGHPLLFDIRYREEILAGFDHMGLRGLLEAHPEAVSEIDVASTLEDVDTPDDYRRMTRKAKG